MGRGIVVLNRLKAQSVIGAWGIGVNEVDVCLEVIARAPLEVILLANMARAQKLRFTTGF